MNKDVRLLKELVRDEGVVVAVRPHVSGKVEILVNIRTKDITLVGEAIGELIHRLRRYGYSHEAVLTSTAKIVERVYSNDDEAAEVK